MSEARLSLTPGGLVRYPLKTPYSDGTTHVLFEPLDFIARLAALAPKPRVNLTRYHGVFAPHSAPPGAGDEGRAGPGRKTPGGQHPGRAPGGDELRAQRLKRVFHIDIETCSVCGGALRLSGLASRIRSSSRRSSPTSMQKRPLQG